MSILAQILGIPQPFEEGQLAAQKGERKDTNPYSGDDYHEWNRGYDYAMEYMQYTFKDYEEK